MASLDQLFSSGYMNVLEKCKDLCYKPQFCRIKPASICEPIQMISKILIDYGKKGYKIDQTKILITQMKEQYGKCLENL